MRKIVKKTKKPSKIAEANEFVEPKFVSMASSPSNTNGQGPLFRRNRAANIPSADKYSNILEGLTPFHSLNSYVDIQFAIELCQQAWYSVPIIRQTIEIFGELCNSRIYLQGGNSTSKKFIGSWLKNIRLEDLKEQFFREYHRSGNIFLFRFDAGFDPDQSQSLTEIYGHVASKYGVNALDLARAANKKFDQPIPIRYVFLNPGRVRTNNTVIFQNSQYFQMLTPIEMSKLRYPKTKEDFDLFNALDSETKKKIKNNIIPYVPLDQERLYPIFAKKMDYEPFAVPFVFPVLEMINAHLELQKIDQAVARTLDRAILLITNGAKKDEGGISPKTLQSLQSLLSTESISRTVVADYTTRGEWLIPKIDDLLGPTKYEELNRQINIGLNSIFFNDNEKFANASIKAKIFVERLAAPRKKFLEFLQDEINRVCDIMNFKTYPQAVFEDITLKDEAEFIRLFTRMAELGILTPQQFFTAVDSGELPDTTSDEYMAEIKKYKDQRDDGLFLPLVGASMQDPTGQAMPGAPGGAKPASGRPQGAKAPQTVKKKVKPIGASISMASLKENAIAAGSLLEEIESKTKKQHKLKELDDNQKHVCMLLSQAIMLNEEKDNWKKSVANYIKSIKSPSEEQLDEIEKLAQEHSVDSYNATILYLSKIEEE